MSVKLICLLAIFTLCALVIITEARGGRGRGGSLGSAFYRRSHKKQSSSGGGGSRRKIISASPVHTDYTNSMLAAQATDEKFARHRSRQRHSHHKSNGHHSSSDGAHAASPHVSHNWGGHQLPPGHVYVTQPSSIPANAVYYAQPPTHTNTDGSTDFALGYLVGRSLTRRRHYHHHHHEQQPQAETNNKTQPSVVIIETQMNATSVAPTTNQTTYWPTDTEVGLAPLNGVTAAEPIFKRPPIVSAQKLTAENATFELPSATASPPETPPTNGIICMPWNFNETDPSTPGSDVVVQKTICFPAPPAPPQPTVPTTTPSSLNDPLADLNVFSIALNPAAFFSKMQARAFDISSSALNTGFPAPPAPPDSPKPTVYTTTPSSLNDPLADLNVSSLALNPDNFDLLLSQLTARAFDISSSALNTGHVQRHKYDQILQNQPYPLPPPRR